MAARRVRSARSETLRARRRELRARATKAERLLWSILRDRRICGYKFRRQHSIGRYIVDFVCIERKLIIELDGGYHEYVDAYDVERQRYLETRGFRVVRFTNEELLEDLNAMAIGIARILLGIR